MTLGRAQIISNVKRCENQHIQTENPVKISKQATKKQTCPARIILWKMFWNHIQNFRWSLYSLQNRRTLAAMVLDTLQLLVLMKPRIDQYAANQLQTRPICLLGSLPHLSTLPLEPPHPLLFPLHMGSAKKKSISKTANTHKLLRKKPFKTVVPTSRVFIITRISSKWEFLSSTDCQKHGPIVSSPPKSSNKPGNS